MSSITVEASCSEPTLVQPHIASPGCVVMPPLSVPAVSDIMMEKSSCLPQRAFAAEPMGVKRMFQGGWLDVDFIYGSAKVILGCNIISIGFLFWPLKIIKMPAGGTTVRAARCIEYHDFPGTIECMPCDLVCFSDKVMSTPGCNVDIAAFIAMVSMKRLYSWPAHFPSPQFHFQPTYPVVEFGGFGELAYEKTVFYSMGDFLVVLDQPGQTDVIFEHYRIWIECIINHYTRHMPLVFADVLSR